MDLRKLSPRSNRVLVPLALLALAGLVFVERGKRVQRSPWHAEMHQAASITSKAFRHLRSVRLERGVFVDPVNDPARTALIGQEYTQITTDRGYLEAKLASTDPNFAAVVVAMLRELEVDNGSCVALGSTGSFPALNISALAALEALSMQAISISSIGASNFGATDPYFTWLDMESELVQSGILSQASVAASLGGGNDSGRGLSPQGRQLLRQAAERNGVPLIEHELLEESVRERIARFEAECGEAGIAAYLNIGGGIASLGHSVNGELIPSGASDLVPARNFPFRGVLLRLNERGVPVIHLRSVSELRDRYGLVPIIDELPAPGQGEVYGRTRYSLSRTLFVTAALVAALVALFTIDARLHRLGAPAPEESS